MSDLKKTSVYHIAKIGAGSVSIGPRPVCRTSSGKNELTRWASMLADVKINRVICLMEAKEIEQFELGAEAAMLSANGIGFSHFPIADFGLPDVARFSVFMGDMIAWLNAGENLFLHCAGGVGRAGTAASCLLMQQGWNPDLAMKHVSDRRGKICPETDEQIAFVRSWNLPV